MGTMGERMKARRLEMKIEKVAELARLAGGISRSALSQLENGITKELSYKNTIAVASALGVNADWLAFCKGPKIESKAKDPNWVAQFSDAQRELFDAIKVYGSFLPDEQCHSLANIIKGSKPREAQAA